MERVRALFLKKQCVHLHRSPTQKAPGLRHRERKLKAMWLFMRTKGVGGERGKAAAPDLVWVIQISFRVSFRYVYESRL